MTIPLTLNDLLQNQFLVGLTGTAILGALAFGGRYLWMAAWRYVKAKWTIELTVDNRSDQFYWMVAWLDKHDYAKKARRLVAAEARSDTVLAIGAESTVAHTKFSPAEGHHFFFHKGTPIWLYRELKIESNRVFEKIQITAITRSANIAREIVQEAFEAYNKSDNRIEVKRVSTSDWYTSGRIIPRSFDSVVLDNGYGQEILEDVKWFLKSQDWYLERGIPYRRGYLISGPPGTGKSSIVEAIAGEFGKPVYVLNPSAVLNDDALCALLGDIRDGGVVVIEDIDATFKKREGKEAGITFSGLLNAIDGVGASQGRLLFLTTNKPLELDEALIRPGRCDKHFEFGNLTEDQAYRFYRRFFPDAPEGLASRLAKSVSDGTVSPAALQGHFLKNLDNPETAANYPKLKAVA